MSRSIYRGYIIEQSGTDWLVYSNGILVHKAATETAAYDWIDAQRRMS